MAVYLLAYDLLSKERDYSEFLEAVRVFQYERLTENTWLIQGAMTATFIRDQLRNFLDEGDRIFVGELSGSHAWANPLTDSKLLKIKLR